MHEIFSTLASSQSCLALLILLTACHEAVGHEAGRLPPSDASTLEAAVDPGPWGDTRDAAPAPDDGSLRDGETEADAGAVDAATGEVTLTVETEAGQLRGKLDQGVRLFLGIPYATPPIGARRFLPPEPLPRWQGTRMASDFGPACIQPVGDLPGPFSEDCLTLNVFSPAQPPAEGAPVLVFLHGGGVMGGGRGYPAQWLTGPTGLVVVTINYRLGPLGFLRHPALDAQGGLPSGNLGLRDQQRALAWVRDNIAALGGDPENVSLVGQSFGAMSSCLHMFAQGSKPLARRMIMQSGSCVTGHMIPLSREQIVSTSDAFVGRSCALKADVPACLRSLPAASFEPSLLELLDWRPHVDGELLEAQPHQLLRDGEARKLSVIVGSNKREWRAFEARGVPRLGSLLELRLAVLLDFPEHSEALLRLYAPADDAQAGDAYARLQTDRMFRCPARQLARMVGERGGSAYLYRFDVNPGAHAQELDYVFGWPSGGPSEQYPKEAPIPPLPSVVQAMQSSWASFAARGLPLISGIGSWPLYGEGRDVMVFAEPSQIEDAPAEDPECALWETIYGSP